MGCHTETATGQERCDWCLSGHRAPAKPDPPASDEYNADTMYAVFRDLIEVFARLYEEARAINRDVRALAATLRGEVDDSDPSSNTRGEQHR
jgi:hypothetical protein